MIAGSGRVQDLSGWIQKRGVPDRPIGPRSYALGCYTGHVRGEGERPAGFQPMATEKCFSFIQTLYRLANAKFKSNLNFEQSLFVKYKNTSSHNKVHSGMNATNIIIYLYK
jgi:hypothetical protein